MNYAKLEELFKKGRLDEALDEINKIPEISIESKLLKALILAYKARFRHALDLADQILADSSFRKDPGVEFKARIVRAIPLTIFLNRSEAFSDINTAENMIDTLNQTMHKTEDLWIAELRLSKGILTEVLFGEKELAIELEQSAYEIFTKLEDYRGAARALNYMSMIYFFEGFLEKSMEVAEKGLTISEGNDIKSEIAFSLYRMGEYYYSVGKLKGAQKVLERGIMIASIIKNKWIEGELRLSLGKVYRRQGAFQGSHLEFQTSIKLAEETGDRHLSAKSILNSGDLLQIRGDAHGAIEKFHHAFRIFRSLKDSNCSIDTNLKLGKAYMILGELNLAYQQFQNSFIHRLWNRSDNQPTDEIPLHMYGYPETLYHLVLITLELELLEQAKQYLNRLEKFYIHEPSGLVYFQARLAKAMVLKQSPRIILKAQAQEILKTLVHENIVDHGLTVFAILNYSEFLVAELELYGESEVLEELQTLFQKLIDLGHNTNAPIVEVEACILSSKINLIEGKTEKASLMLNQARNTVEKEGLPYLLPKIIQHQESLNQGMKGAFDKGDHKERLRERLERIQLQSYLIDSLRTSLIHDIGTEVFPISKRIHGKKYQLVHRNFLQELGRLQKETCRVAVAQIGLSTKNDILGEFYQELGPGLFSIRNEKLEEISTKVKKITEEAYSNGANVLLFPELSIDLNHLRFLDEISSYAKQYQMYIIPGTYHKKDISKNLGCVVTPHGILWEQDKHIPAIITFEGQRIIEGIDVGTFPKEIIVGETEFGRMAIVICRDFLDMDLRVELKNAEPPVDLLFNLAFTPVTADFKAAHFDARRSIYAYCFFVNIAEYGNSLIYTPEKERTERVLPARQEGIIYKDVDLFQLRSERKKWEKKRESESPFIQSTR